MRVVNLEILGHPINIVTILLVIVLFWFALFILNNRGAIGSLAGNTTEGN